MRAFLRSRLAAGLMVGVLVFLVVIALREGGMLESLELTAYDWHLRLRPPVPERTTRVALVTITEEDIQKLGRWPMADATMARALQTLVDAGARAIGVDIYRDIPVPPGREQLDSVLSRHHRIIMTMKFPRPGSPGVGPPPVLKGTDRFGFTDMVVDPDGIVRRGVLFLDDGKNVTYSLGLRLVLRYLQTAGVPVRGDPDHPTYIRLGSTTIRPFEPNDGGYVRADAGGYQFLLDYRDPPRAFPTITFSQLLAKQFDAKLLKDKVVLVGATAESLRDNFFTPFNRTLRDTEPMWGVALHANIVSQLLRSAIEGDTPLAVISDTDESIWILLWCLLGATMALYFRSTWRFALGALGGLVLLTLAVQGVFVLGWWIPLVPSGLGWLGSAGLVTAYISSREKKDRANLMNLFSRHISPQLANLIWDEREKFLSGGRPRPQKLTATAFFTDIVGFTPTSEKLDPQALIDWLNEYMEAMAPTVSEQKGVILRFVGDAIVAAFGIPLASTSEEEIRRDAMNAVNCGLAMQRKLIEHNQNLQQRGLPMIGMRIGIFTGPMVAGSLGSALRLEYTVIGDTVNTASRLESFGKESFVPDHLSSPCRILVGQPTFDLVGDQFITEPVGEVRLKGKAQGLAVYRVLGPKGTHAASSRQQNPVENGQSVSRTAGPGAG